MPLLQDNRPSDKIKRAYGIKERKLLPTVSPELVPVVVVDNLSEDIDIRRAMGSDLRAGGGAGNFNTWRITNNAESNALITIKSIIVTSSTAQINWRWNVTDVAALANNIGAGGWIDGRLAGFPSVTLRHDAVAVQLTMAGGSGWRCHLIEGSGVLHELLVGNDVVLIPGGQLTIQQEQANIEGCVIFFWEERDLQPTD